MKVYFIGAGPGDPELLTLKAHKILQQAHLVLYAGSLIPTQMLQFAPPYAECIDTASMSLPDIAACMQKAQSGQIIARLHCGDISFYSAIAEQIQQVKAMGVDYEIIPGVSSLAASAAKLGIELTLPALAQNVIITRFPGKTPHPNAKNWAQLAQAGSILAIFLSMARIHRIAKELIPIYGATCPVIVAYRVSWSDEQFIIGQLADITEKVRAAKINRSAIILVGEALRQEFHHTSYLYDANQAHIFRPKYKRKKPRELPSA